MRDSVPSGSSSSVCNVLRQWKSRSSLLIESTDSMIYRLEISRRTRWWCLKCVIVYLAGAIQALSPNVAAIGADYRD